MIKIKNDYLRWLLIGVIILLCNPLTIIGLFLYGAAQGM